LTADRQRGATRIRVGIFYPADPAGHVPGGIDTFIRSLLQWAPPDIEYYLYGASSDPQARPPGREVNFELGGRQLQFLPVTHMNPAGSRGRMPLTVRYMWSLWRLLRSGALPRYDALDFHRIEPILLFRNDRLPKNIYMHSDMSVIRNKNTDIKWRHVPWLYDRLQGYIFARMDRIFSVRESVAQHHAALYPQWTERFEFLPTWVDTSVYRPLPDGNKELRAGWRAAHGIPAGSRALLFVGRLDRSKNPLLALHAVRLALQTQPLLHLVVVGDGSQRADVEALAASDALSGRVTMTGAQPRHEVARIMQSSDMLIMSSAYEGMPIAALEALATGLPVVSTTVGELPRLISNGVNGILCADQTAESLCAALLQADSRLPQMQGGPCVTSALPYHPEGILARIQANHRRQAATQPP
jgi:glycosyltransferase involved in cell wall biosynthesis